MKYIVFSFAPLQCSMKGAGFLSRSKFICQPKALKIRFFLRIGVQGTMLKGETVPFILFHRIPNNLLSSETQSLGKKIF